MGSEMCIRDRWIAVDHSRCADCLTRGCVDACSPRILKLEEGKPVLAVDPVDAGKGKCTECLACEIYCKFQERDAIVIHLPIPGLKEYRDRIIRWQKTAGGTEPQT